MKLPQKYKYNIAGSFRKIQVSDVQFNQIKDKLETDENFRIIEVTEDRYPQRTSTARKICKASENQRILRHCKWKSYLPTVVYAINEDDPDLSKQFRKWYLKKCEKDA